VNSSTELEYKYRVPYAGQTLLLPFSNAKKYTAYPALCIFHDDEPARAAKNSHLCEACREGIRRSLDDIGQRWPDLEQALGANGGASNSERVSGGGDLFPALPINPAVSETMGKARSLIWSTVGQLVQDMPDQRLPRDHGTGVLADWLARWHVGYLASHPSVDHLVAVCVELASVAEDCRATVYQANTFELEMRDASCHSTVIGPAGLPVPCLGEVIGRMKPDGQKVVECSADPLHRVSADQWFQAHARRESYRKRDAARLARKYAPKTKVNSK
jgi:hypothetical protein